MSQILERLKDDLERAKKHNGDWYHLPDIIEHIQTLEDNARTVKESKAQINEEDYWKAVKLSNVSDYPSFAIFEELKKMNLIKLNEKNL